MRDDLRGVALATLLFAFLLVPPGYCFGWILDLLEFRRQSWPWRLATSLVLSIAMVPILDFLLWRYASLAAVWILYAAACIFFLGNYIREWGAARSPRGASRMARTAIPGWAWGAASAWLLIAWLSGVDLQIGHRLFPSVLSYDFNLRTALIDGIARHGLPAQNPLFFPGHAEPLRYHYFWLIPCALVDLLGGKWLNARHALIASDVWCGWALMATIALYCRFLHPAGGRGLEKRVKWGIAILAIAGLDILPNLAADVFYFFLKHGPVYASMEWWNNQVTSYLDSMLWVAHHVASALACFAGFLILWRGVRPPGNRAVAAGICAGLCFASAAGLSIYVTLTFAIFLTMWGGIAVIRGPARARIAWLTSGVIAIAAALPYLRGLGQAGGSGGRLLNITVRHFTPFDLLLPVIGWSHHQVTAANFVAIPLNYFLETGVWFLLAVLWWKRAWRRRAHLGEAELAALGMFAVSLLVGTFLRSGVIGNNDLGWRGLLMAQVIVLVWSIEPVRAWWRLRSRSAPPRLAKWRRRMTVLIALGLASTVYEVLCLRLYFPLTAVNAVPQAEWFGYDRDPGRRTYQARQVYERLDRMLPPGAVIQANPTHWDDIYHGLYALRQTASFDAACGATFGGTANCAAMQTELAPLFNDPAAARHADLDTICSGWGITVLVAKDDDPVYADRSAWPWTHAAIAETGQVRAIPCGAARPGAGPGAAATAARATIR